MSSNLFAGQPIPPQPTGQETTNQLPLWASQFQANLDAAATQLAQQPYQAMPFSPVAAPSSQTQQAWQMANNNVGSWQPAIGAAGALTMSAATPLSTGQIQDYSGGYGSGVSNLQRGLAPGYAGNETGLIGALNSAYAPNVEGSGTGITGALNQSVQSQIPNYTNPYLNFIEQGITSQLDTNLRQNILPGVQDRYVASGQTGSPQQMQAENNAIYGTQQAAGQAIAGALQNVYGTGLSAAEGAANSGFGSASSGALGSMSSGATGAGQLLGAGQYGYGLGTSTAQGQQQIQQTAGAQFGQLGALNAQLNASDVAQVGAAGQGQDTANQNAVNAQTNNWQQQIQWPYQQLGYASNIVRGQNIPTNQQTVGLSYSPNAGSTASPLSTALGTTAIAGALNNGSTLQLARGGSARPRATRGALSLAA